MVGLSKADVKRTFNTYALGQKSITVEDAFEMFQDMDDNFPDNLEQFTVKFNEHDLNHDGRINADEAWNLYKAYYPTEEYL